MADKHSTGLYCFLGGLGVGLAGGILFAPHSGTGTRDRIRAKADEARDLVSAKADMGREYLNRQGAILIDQTKEFIERGKRIVNDQQERVARAVEAGKTAYRAAVG
jgi:gas vesicle protein